MATYVLIHGAGSDSWYWHRVTPLLRARGHEVVAPDLPVTDDSAGLAEYRDTVLDAIGDRTGLVVVAQSAAGFTAPLLCEQADVALIVLLNAMVPAPGEPPGEWWGNTGQADAQRELDLHEGRDPDAEFDPLVTFLHDLPDELIEESGRHASDQSGTPFEKPWPLDAWPDVPTKVLIGRDDRLFPADFQRRVALERLGLEADEIPGGHLAALSYPRELVDRLERYRAEMSRD